MGNNTLPYLGITKIDDIEYHTFYSNRVAKATIDYRAHFFSLNIPENIKDNNIKKFEFIRNYWKPILKMNMKNVFIIGDLKINDSIIRYYDLLRNHDIQIYSDINDIDDTLFNITEIRLYGERINNDFYISTNSDSLNSIKKFKAFERKLKISKLFN